MCNKKFKTVAYIFWLLLFIYHFHVLLLSLISFRFTDYQHDRILFQLETKVKLWISFSFDLWKLVEVSPKQTYTNMPSEPTIHFSRAIFVGFREGIFLGNTHTMITNKTHSTSSIFSCPIFSWFQTLHLLSCSVYHIIIYHIEFRKKKNMKHEIHQLLFQPKPPQPHPHSAAFFRWFFSRRNNLSASCVCTRRCDPTETELDSYFLGLENFQKHHSELLFIWNESPAHDLVGVIPIQIPPEVNGVLVIGFGGSSHTEPQEVSLDV